MAKPELPPYPLDVLAQIRAARAALYETQAERRRLMLATGTWQLPRERELGPVQAARAQLDAARAAAQSQPEPKESRDADLRLRMPPLP